MAARLELLKEQFFTDDGSAVLSGGLLYTYVVGTTTPKATYTTLLGDVAQANPVVLDSNGRIPSDLYGVGAYKIVIKDSAGTTIDTIPTVSGANASSFTTIGDYSGDLDAAITAIGATATTLYIDDTATMSANTIIPATCTVILNKGGSIVQSTFNLTIQGLIVFNGGTISGTGTLTVTGQIQGGDYQAISTTGTITIDDFCKTIWVPSINVAVESGAQVVEITPNVTHTITASIDLVSNQTVYGFGDKSLINLGANVDAFTIDGKSNVVLRDFKVDGKKATYTTTDNNAISSPANGTGSTNILIRNIHAVDIAGNAIEILSQTGSHSENIRILNNIIEDPGAHGIVCQDFVDDVLIDGNRIINYGADVASKVGIATGRDGINQTVSNNYIESDGGAGGASAHGITIDKTSYFTVTGNVITGTTGYGIEIGNSQIGSVTGNTTYSTTRCGIGVIGDENVQVCKHITVSGNTIWQPATLAGIYVHTSNQALAYGEDITIVGNTIHNSVAAPGILISYGLNGVVSNNTIVDSYQDGIRFQDSTFFVVNGNLLKGSNSADTAGRQLGVVKSTSTSIIVNGFDVVDTTDGATSGTGEDTLKTYSIPQETYNDWRGIRVVAAGTKTGANGNKTIKFYIGTSSLTFNAAANDTNDWRFQADIPFSALTAASDSYYVSWLGWNGATPLQGYEFWAEDNTSAAVTMKVTGECANAGDTITQTVWMVEYY